MKSTFLLKTCARSLGAALGLSLAAPQAYAYFEVSVGVSIQSSADFYTPLSYEGAWLDLSPYGRCWRPAGVAVDWRPYCNGSWEWTDCGWYWNSDEPWAWACYHYGSWVDDPNYGWVWLPGTEWAPAWVTWREGDGCIGWAPYGPSGIQVVPAAFVFVRERHFHERIRPDVVIMNDPQIVRQTYEIQGVRREDREVEGHVRPVVVNSGPSVDTIERSGGHRFNRVPVTEAENRTIQSAPERVRRSIGSSVQQNPDRQNGSPYARPERNGERKNAVPSSGYNNYKNNSYNQRSTPQRGQLSPGYTQPDRPTEQQNSVPNPGYLDRQRQTTPPNETPNYRQERQGELRSPNPARPYQEIPQSSPRRNSEFPQQFQRGSETPERNSAPVQTYPQAAPSERQIPVPSQGVPRDRRENPSREMMSPGQMGHPGIPAGQQVRPQVPVTPPPAQAPERENGNDKKDRGQ